MENAYVSQILGEMADVCEIKGLNPFKVRAYRSAALTIESTPLNVVTIAAAGGAARLREIPGIGEGIAKKIVEIAETGDCKEHIELVRLVPPTLIELLHIPGVGPKKVKLFHEELGIRDLDELEAAAKAQKLRTLPKLGAKSEQAILTGIERYRQRSGRFLRTQARDIMATLLEALREVDGVERVEAAGSYRRCKETVGDLDLICITTRPGEAMDRFARFGEALARGEKKCTIRLPSGLNADLRVLPRESFGAAMHYFTGSKAHNIAIRTMAVKRGLTINEYGVFEVGPDGEPGRRIGGATEEEVFAAVELPWIPPELREAAGEVEAAAEGRLPRLLEREDLQGDLHMHTHATDGKASIEEMAEAAIARGHRYIAITDHSKALAMTRGLDEARLRAQGDAIRAAERALQGRIRILRGIEVDILADGALDLERDALLELDVVVASVHSRLQMEREEMTQRMVRAIESGCVDVIGHPTGRILRRRDPYPLDMERVLRAARDHGVAMEVSATPNRLDLNDHHCRLAKELGVKLVISTDAHTPESLDFLAFGIDNARRGWLERDDVVNTRRDPEAMLALLHEGHR